jgi:quinolinate synthase
MMKELTSLAAQDTELIERIARLKEEKHAVILAHNYQIGEVQDIADFVGDSLGLSQEAAKTDAEIIVFCGVDFMAETASILSPSKLVLLPDENAGCPMAEMITVEDLLAEKQKYPQAEVVCYVNSTADVKAESDVCCTSSNAVKIVNSVESPEVLFIPDKYLGQYAASKSGKIIHYWNGFCPTHARILAEDIIEMKKKHPKAQAIVHPECMPEVIRAADAVGSTGGILEFAKKSSASEIIVGTEVGILHRLRKENPGKKFYPASDKAVCPNMKLTNLEKVLWSLEEIKHVVRVPEEIRTKALDAVNKMISIT